MPMRTKEEQREYQRLWMKKRRDEWIAENGPCAECGTWDDLDVDHKNPKDKLYNVSSLWSLAKNNPKRVSELAKCQVLCTSCHQSKTNKDNNFTPDQCGTRYKYIKGCRCRKCVTTESARRSENRAKQKRRESSPPP